VSKRQRNITILKQGANHQELKGGESTLGILSKKGEKNPDGDCEGGRESRGSVGRSFCFLSKSRGFERRPGHLRKRTLAGGPTKKTCSGGESGRKSNQLPGALSINVLVGFIRRRKRKLNAVNLASNLDL